MKQPRHGIRSTTPKPIKSVTVQTVGDANHHVPNPPMQAVPIQMLQIPVMQDTTMPNLIGDDEDDASIANVFCFGAFAEKQSGVMYNDLTGSFPFMSLDGSV